MCMVFRRQCGRASGDPLLPKPPESSLMRVLLKWLMSCSDPEAEIAVPAHIVPSIASGWADVLRTSVPGTTAADMGVTRAICGSRRAVLQCAVVVVVVAVLNPLPNVAEHVVDPEPIGSERADRGRLSVV